MFKKICIPARQFMKSNLAKVHFFPLKVYWTMFLSPFSFEYCCYKCSVLLIDISDTCVNCDCIDISDACQL